MCHLQLAPYRRRLPSPGRSYSHPPASSDDPHVIPFLCKPEPAELHGLATNATSGSRRVSARGRRPAEIDTRSAGRLVQVPAPDCALIPFEVPIAAHQARDAFNHPYAYSAEQETETVAATSFAA
jgi:hypothetical protein